MYFTSQSNVYAFFTKITLMFKDSIFLKNRHFIIQEGFDKLIYGINTMIIIKCGPDSL